MEIAFNVPSGGPLSQIGIHLMSFETAVHLATGAIGWWKSRERTISLKESITASNAALVGTSAFNIASYRESREHGFIQSFAVENGALRAAKGSVKSTAVSDDPAVDCLRALTTGLLCFYAVELTTLILADIIPYGLVQPDQIDKPPEFTGPLLASLKDFVSSVAAEEDCNTFRGYLLQYVFNCQNALYGAEIGKVLECDLIDEDDLNHVIGVLRWMITPAHGRESGRYPTRSLKVWNTAVVMHKLGFEISASLEVVNSSAQYAQFVRINTNHGSQYPDVVLITASVGETDPMMSYKLHAESMRLRPQIIPIQSVPLVAFGRLQGNDRKVNRDLLVDIWKTSYRFAQAAVQLPTMSKGGMVTIPIKSEDTKVQRDRHISLVSLWSTHLTSILGPAMEMYIPGSPDAEDWSPEKIRGFFDRRANGEDMLFESDEIIGNCYQLIAIMLGAIYGVCEKTLIPMKTESGELRASEFLEVAFEPHLIYGQKLFGWVDVLGKALLGIVDLSRWIGLILELVTGVEHKLPLDRQPSEKMAVRLKTIDNIFDHDHVRISGIFGAQANGMCVVSDFIVRPSCQANALKFHVGQGRILNLPVDEDGYLRAAQAKAAVRNLILDPEPQLIVLRKEPSGSSILSASETIRVDAEPCWGGNVRTIQFVVRKTGVTVAKLSLIDMLIRLQNNTVHCQCDQPQYQIKVPQSERWQTVTLDQLLFNPGLTRTSQLSAAVDDQDKILIDVHGDDMCRFLVTGILHCRKMIICRDCVYCAYNSIRFRERKESVALIVG